MKPIRAARPISASTDVYAVIGDPIRHSLSPAIHNCWIEEEGLEAVYLALNLKGDDPADAMRAAFDLGFSGLNVTLPYKGAALAAATRVDPLARRLGAANVLVRGETGWIAHNTDQMGVRAALAYAAPDLNLTGKQVLLIGAGGSARAALFALSEMGAQVMLANRTLERAQTLSEELGIKTELVDLNRVADVSRGSRLVVNATSVGFSHSAIGLGPAPADGLAFDLSYGRAAEGFLSEATKKGWRTLDGLPMLVAQAAGSVSLWRGVHHPIGPALDALVGRASS
jgi:shikimate dehydrogenase